MTLLPSEKAKKCFYQALDEGLCWFPKRDKILLFGDFNPRVGQNQPQDAIRKLNANGMRLLTFCCEHNLIISDTIFQQKAKYNTSWMHPRYTLAMIDFTVGCRDIKDVLITMRGAECWTDHCCKIATAWET